jgi:serine/threonine protein kinase
VAFQRVSGGELQSLLDRDEVLEERHVARLMGQILEAIAFLHSINVAHLDIKVIKNHTRLKLTTVFTIQ